MSDGIVARTTREQERRERSTKTGEGGDLAKCSEETEFVKLALWLLCYARIWSDSDRGRQG